MNVGGCFLLREGKVNSNFPSDSGATYSRVWFNPTLSWIWVFVIPWKVPTCVIVAALWGPSTFGASSKLFGIQTS